MPLESYTSDKTINAQIIAIVKKPDFKAFFGVAFLSSSFISSCMKSPISPYFSKKANRFTFFTLFFTSVRINSRSILTYCSRRLKAVMPTSTTIAIKIGSTLCLSSIVPTVE